MPSVAAERGANEAQRATRRRGASVSVLVATVVVVDQATKAWAVHRLSRGPIGIVGDTVELRLTRNAGGAFGLGPGLTPFLAVAALVVTVALAVAVRRTSDRPTLVALALLLGGALGNLVDRVARAPRVLSGRVVDFIRLGWWPSFNVADASVTAGIVVLLVLAVFPRQERPDA